MNFAMDGSAANMDLYTTPEELRRLADLLEAATPVIHSGKWIDVDEVVTVFIYNDTGE